MKTTKELFEMVKKYLERNFYFFEDQQYTIVSVYVLLTWIYDQFPHCPYLLVEGNLGTGKSMLGHVLSKVVYNFVETGEACSVGVLFNLVDKNRGTVIFDNASLIFHSINKKNNDFSKLLTVGFQSDGAVYRMEDKGSDGIIEKRYTTYCPKILFTYPGEKDLERAILTRSIKLITHPDVTLGELRARNIPIDYNTEKLEVESLEIKKELKTWRDTKVAEKINLDYSLFDDDYSVRASMKILPMLTIFNEFATKEELDLMKEYVENSTLDPKSRTLFVIDRQLKKIGKDKDLYVSLYKEGKFGEPQFSVTELNKVIFERTGIKISNQRLVLILRKSLGYGFTRSSSGLFMNLDERLMQMHIDAINNSTGGE